MPYLALKPCKFCTDHYLVDDIIPDEAVDQSVVRVLEDAGVIKHIPAQSVESTSGATAETGKEGGQTENPPEDPEKSGTDNGNPAPENLPGDEHEKPTEPEEPKAKSASGRKKAG